MSLLALGAPGFQRSGRRAVLALLLPVVCIALWQWLGSYGFLVEGVIPTPLKVAEAWKVWAFGAGGFTLNPYSGTWWSNLVFSTQRVGQGYLLAILVGVPLGVLIGWSRIAAQLVDPSIQWLRPIPIVGWSSMARSKKMRSLMPSAPPRSPV